MKSARLLIALLCAHSRGLESLRELMEAEAQHKE
jgi:hypothetical protein